MNFVVHEPAEYSFRDVNGHHGKLLAKSAYKSHLIIECDEKLTVSLCQNEVEFSYYILEGDGYFILNGEREKVAPGDLVVVPVGTVYTFGGKLRMLLVNAPHWSPEQEDIIYE
ncbi:hypothetical protein JNM87_04375 [Candidatus Saccharibacteria bacterium]|nr:hypothetical protein [Candidatus Saccharibacteria bacterium]